MRLKVHSEKDVREYIRQAFMIDRRIPMFKPDGCPCRLGKIVPSEITPETQAYEIKVPVTREELALWGIVLGRWLPSLPLDDHNLVKYRHDADWRKRRWKVIAKEHYGGCNPHALNVRYLRIIRRLFLQVRSGPSCS